MRKIPRLEHLIARKELEIESRWELRPVAFGSAPIYLTEEQRESHIHILGAPGQGKSKLLELLIRQDLERGYGACLLDPSDNGETMYKVLKWCIKNNFKKVVIIDPHDKYVPVIRPRHNLMDTVRVQFSTKDVAETPAIQKYLPAVIHALHKAKEPLSSFLYFTSRKDFEYRIKRNEILEKLSPRNRHRIYLDEVFNNAYMFDRDFASTIRRMEPFLDYYMTLMFSNHEAIPFQKLVKNGYLVLCNLDYTGVSDTFGNEHQRLIGTTIINEIFYAMSTLRAHGWKGIYYLYIDEVGDYATSSLATILDKKRKTGLRFTFAHQRFGQIHDKAVEDAIYSTMTKFLFNTPNPNDMRKMIDMMYGSLPEKEVRYVLSQLHKRQAAIKIEKASSVIAVLNDVPDVHVSQHEVDEFKKQIYKRPYYRARKKEDVNEEKPTVKRVAEHGSEYKAKRQSNRSSKARTVPDNLPDSGSILLSKKGRPAGNQTGVHKREEHE